MLSLELKGNLFRHLLLEEIFHPSQTQWEIRRPWWNKRMPVIEAEKVKELLLKYYVFSWIISLPTGQNASLPFLRANENLLFPPANFPLAEIPLWLAGDWVLLSTGEEEWMTLWRANWRLNTWRCVKVLPCPLLFLESRIPFLASSSMQSDWGTGPISSAAFQQKQDTPAGGLLWNSDDTTGEIQSHTCASPPVPALHEECWRGANGQMDEWISPQELFLSVPLYFLANLWKSKEHM